MSDLLVNYTQEFLEKKEDSKLRAILQRAFNITKGISKLSKQELIDLILQNRNDVKQKLADSHNINPELIYKSEEGVEFKAEFQPETEEFDECVILTDAEGEQAYEVLEDFNNNFKQMRYSNFSDKDAVKPEVLGEDEELMEQFSPNIEESEDVDQTKDDVTEKVAEEKVAFKTLKNQKAAVNAYSKIHKEIMQRYGYLSEEEDGYLEDRSKINKATTKEFKETYGFDSLDEAKASLEETVVEQKKPKAALKGSKSSRVIEIVKDFEKKGTEYTSGTVMKKLKELHGEDIHRSFCITLINRAKNQ